MQWLLQWEPCLILYRVKLLMVVEIVTVNFTIKTALTGSLLQVAVKGVVRGAVSELKNEAVNAFNSLLNGKRTKDTTGAAWVNSELVKQEAEQKTYGMMHVDGGTIYALDDWGGTATEALMLGIELDQSITVNQKFPVYRTKVIDAKKEFIKNKSLTLLRTP